MEAKSTFTFYLFCIFFCWCTFDVCGSNIKRKCVLDKLSTQIGVKELTGHNDGKQIDEYHKAAGFKSGSKYAYCSSFMMWGYKGCNITISGVNAMALSWFKKDKLVYKQGENWNKVKIADLFGLYYKDKKNIAHVGVIESIHSTYIITIEGNTSASASIGSSEDRDASKGGGVYRKRRMKKGIYAVASWIK